MKTRERIQRRVVGYCVVALGMALLLPSNAWAQKKQSPGKKSTSKISKVTARRDLKQGQTIAKRIYEVHMSSALKAHQRMMSAVEKDSRKAIAQFNAAVQREKGGAEAIKNYKSNITALKKARTTKQRYAAKTSITRQFTSQRALITKASSKPLVDKSVLIKGVSRRYSGVYGPLRATVGRNGEIIFTSRDPNKPPFGEFEYRGDSNESGETVYVPTPVDFCLTPPYALAPRVTGGDDANTDRDSSSGTMEVELSSGATLPGLINYSYASVGYGGIVTVPAGSDNLKVAAEVKIEYEGELSAFGGYASMVGRVDLLLVPLPANAGNDNAVEEWLEEQDYGDDAVYVVHQLSTGSVVLAGDLDYPEGGAEEETITLSADVPISNSERDYIVIAGVLFIADTTGLASAAGEVEATVVDICLRED